MIIPQPSAAATAGRDLIGSEFCGRGLFFPPATMPTLTDAVVATAATYATICCKFILLAQGPSGPELGASGAPSAGPSGQPQAKGAMPV